MCQHHWMDAVMYFDGACAFCGRTMRKNETLQRTKLIPSGDATPSNTVPACCYCDANKGDDEWRTWYIQQHFFSQERMNKVFTWRSIVKAAGEDE